MATVEEKDQEEARRIRRDMHTITGFNLEAAIAQALATARAEGAAEEREASKLCPNCVVLAGWKPGDRCAARWWSTISDCELVCEDPATHATIAAPTCSRHARDGALPIDEFFREEDIIRRRLAAIRSRGSAPERLCKCAKYGVGACDIHGPRCCIHCGRNGCSCSKPAPVGPIHPKLRQFDAPAPEDFRAGPAPERLEGSACWCSEYNSSGIPCAPGKCPNAPKPAPVDPDPDLPYSHVPGKVVAKYRATRVDEEAPVDPAPERPAVGSCGWHPCGTCADKRASMKPAPVDPVREAAKARLVSGHNDTCASMLDSKYGCSCGHDALAAALEKSDAR